MAHGDIITPLTTKDMNFTVAPIPPSAQRSDGWSREKGLVVESHIQAADGLRLCGWAPKTPREIRNRSRSVTFMLYYFHRSR